MLCTPKKQEVREKSGSCKNYNACIERPLASVFGAVC